MAQQRILILDDDQDIQLLLARFLKKNGFHVDTAGRGSEARALLERGRYDLVLCDHRLPDTDGLEMVQHIRASDSATQVIVITGFSEVRLAVELMRRGAFDYITKPLYPDELLMRVQDALRAPARNDGAAAANGHAKRSNGQAPAGKVLEFVEGTGPVAGTINKHMALVAPTDMTVLITGETGTGKEFVAKRLHQLSARADAPFIAVDCGALPKELAGSELFGHTKGAFTGAVTDRAGSFELADGGTLFLDEVGNLSYDNQVKLLRVLQERRIRRIGGTKDMAVDVRILAATNEDLAKAVAEGRFREDLLHRINEFTIHLPPLRERKDDIERFAMHFMHQANERLGRTVQGFEPEAMRSLRAHHWSGNLRELGNVVKRAVLLSTDDLVSADCLPAIVLAGPNARTAATADITVAPDDGLRNVAQQAERQAILAALERNGFNKSRTAEHLNIDRKTLYNKLRAFGIEL